MGETLSSNVICDIFDCYANKQYGIERLFLSLGYNDISKASFSEKQIYLRKLIREYGVPDKNGQEIYIYLGLDDRYSSYAPKDRIRQYAEDYSEQLGVEQSAIEKRVKRRLKDLAVRMAEDTGKKENVPLLRSTNDCLHHFDTALIYKEKAGNKSKKSRNKKIYGNLPARNPCYVDQYNRIDLLAEYLNKSFFDIQKLAQALTESTSIYLKLGEHISACCITGLPGIGKTALASEYAYRMQDSYDYIIFLDGSLPYDSTEDYARNVENDTGIKDILTFLQMKDNWLVIYDDIAVEEVVRLMPESPLVAKHPYISNSDSPSFLKQIVEIESERLKRGHIIVTSRYWLSSFWNPIWLQELSEREKEELFRRNYAPSYGNFYAKSSRYRERSIVIGELPGYPPMIEKVAREYDEKNKLSGFSGPMHAERPFSLMSEYEMGLVANYVETVGEEPFGGYRWLLSELSDFPTAVLYLKLCLVAEKMLSPQGSVKIRNLEPETIEQYPELFSREGREGLVKIWKAFCLPEDVDGLFNTAFEGFLFHQMKENGEYEQMEELSKILGCGC